MPKSAKKMHALLKRHGRKVAAVAGVVVLAIGAFGIAVAAQAEPGRLPQGLKAYGISLGNLTPAEAKERLQGAASDFTLTFQAPQQQKELRPFASEKEEAPIASLPIEAVVSDAASLSATNRPGAVIRRARAALIGTDISRPPKINEDAMQDWLEDAFAAHVTAPKNPAFVVSGSGSSLALDIKEGRSGEQLLFDLAVRSAKKRIAYLDSGEVTVVSVSAEPSVRASELRQHEAAAASIAKLAPLTVEAKGASRTVGASELVGWLTVADNALALDRTAVEATLEPWGKTIAVAPKNAVFEEKNGKVTAFAADAPGEGLDMTASIDTIDAALRPNFAKPGSAPLGRLTLPMRQIPAAITLAQANPYGISEVLGVGESNFAGSPANRRTNIRIGYTTLNGVIIKPGETFSLIKALGAIDASQGYLQELVIKGNETTPEYGGGLCQIGTTMFRASLDAGLVIPERRNHSYRVSYYERAGDGSYMGPGKDATIYDPSPDLKITNDTPHAVMIHTVANGDRLTFTLWGKKDGRKAEQTNAVITNTVPPPPPKLIETTTLKPGEKKCTEKPHPGADATFTYTVTYPSGEVKKVDFFSRYRPWGEVCLVGVDPNAAPATPPADGTAAPILPSEDAAGAAGN